MFFLLWFVRYSEYNFDEFFEFIYWGFGYWVYMGLWENMGFVVVVVCLCWFDDNWLWFKFLEWDESFIFF